MYYGLALGEHQALNLIIFLLFTFDDISYA